MKTFTFNSITSDNLGIVVKEMPPVPKASRNIESLEVNGRNGNLHIDNGNYLARDYSIKCIVKDLTKMDLIKSTLEGTHNLTLSIEPNRTFQATIKNQVDFSTYLKVLNEFPLQLELAPFSEGVEKTINKTATASFTIGGNINTYPTIKITGTGTITLNNKQVAVTESDISIDCDLMVCQKSGVSKSNKVTLTEFPFLVAGSNTLNVGTGISNVEIKYKERWY